MKSILIILTLLLSIPIFCQENLYRRELQVILEQTLYVREATNNNDGIEVEEFLGHVGLGPGYPWCAAYTTWGLNQCGVPNPTSAWSPDWAREKDIIWSQRLIKQRKAGVPQAGDTFTLYYPKLNRVGHVGFFIEEASNGYFITIEGNTNDGGSRLGIGVFKRKRDPRKIYAITNYITPYLNN